MTMKSLFWCCPILLALVAAPVLAAKPSARGAKAAVPAPAPATAKLEQATGTPEARAILEEVTRAYRGFDRYHFAGDMHILVTVQGQPQNVEMPFTIAVSKPGKKRTEITNPMLRMLMVSDGETTWMYMPQLGQYTKKTMSTIEEPGAAPTAIAAGTPVARYLAMSDGLTSSRVVTEQALDFEGAPRACWLVEATYQRPATPEMKASPTTFWVEKSRHIVLRESTLVQLNNSPAGGPMTMNQVTTFDVARVNVPLPDSLFTFQVPEGARQVEEIAMPGMQQPESELVGKPAATFALKNLAGKSTSLAAWKGKVVLLDFWASWCGPCRMEMPTIAKLDKELKAKGLMVVGVNVGETANIASGFLKKNGYAFSVLLDSDSEVSQQYGASGLPTVVIIDRSGNVSSHFIGVRSEEQLRAALRKAGIE